MLMCGPATFRRTVTQPNGPADLYGADGAYTASTLPAGSGGETPALPGEGREGAAAVDPL